MTDLNNLIVQQQEIAAQINAAMRPMVADLHRQLTAPTVQKLVKTLTEAREQLPDGPVKEQVGNVLVVLTAVPDFLAAETARLTPAPVEEGAEE